MAGMKSTETKQVFKDPNRPVTRKQEPIREPNKTDIQMTSNLIYTILIPNKQQIKLYRALYLCFATKTLCMISLRQN